MKRTTDSADVVLALLSNPQAVDKTVTEIQTLPEPNRHARAIFTGLNITDPPSAENFRSSCLERGVMRPGDERKPVYGKGFSSLMQRLINARKGG